MSSPKYTVIYTQNGVFYKLCKVWFGSDGSYYVTCPYHPEQKAIVLKMPINYARQELRTPTDDMIDVATLDDDDRRLKLAHHPDGFIQFSGSGILSGKDPDGTIRGMGVQSWPLTRPMRGPSFGLTITGIEHFAQTPDLPKDSVVFRHSEVFMLPTARTFVLEGHYLPPQWRRFVRTNSNNEPTISTMHPALVSVPLKVIFPSATCALQGFIGFEFYTLPPGENEDVIVPRFALTSATGNARKNLDGEIVAEELAAMFPRPEVIARRDLSYRMREIPPSGRYDTPPDFTDSAP